MLIAILSSLSGCTTSTTQAEEPHEDAPQVYGHRIYVSCDELADIELGDTEVWGLDVWYCDTEDCITHDARWDLVAPGVMEIYTACKDRQYMVTWLSAER